MSDTDKQRVLAQFDKKTQDDKAAVASADGEQYDAYKAVDKRQVSVSFFPVNAPELTASYPYLLYALASPSGRRLDVAFSFALVTITGRNLREVRDALMNGRCPFVQQFDAGRWPTPKDASLPFVESISFLMTAPQDVTGEKEPA